MEKGSRLKRQIWAAALVSVAALLILSLASHHPSDRSLYEAAGSSKELYAFVSYHVANFLRQAVGLCAFLLPIFLLFMAYQVFNQAPEVTPLRVASYGVFVLFIVPMLISVVLESDEVWDSGGVIGGFSKSAILMPLFGQMGAYVVSISIFLLGFVLVWRVSLTDLITGLVWRQVAADEPEVEAQFARPEPAGQDGLNTTPPLIEKKPEPVQASFDFMEKVAK